MAAFLDICRFNPTAGGLTDWTFATAVTGYQSPALAGAVNGRVYKVRSESADLSQWELSEGAYNSATGVFARTTVLFNSLGTGTAAGQSGAGTKINFSAAPQVAVVALKEDLLSIEEANSFTAAQQAQARSNIGAPPATTPLTASLGANVALNNTANFFDGPSIAQGSTGTWFVSGTVSCQDSAGAARFDVKLWDGTTVIASASNTSGGASFVAAIALSGYITSPAGNLRISCRDANTANGAIVAASAGIGGSTISAFRIA